MGKTGDLCSYVILVEVKYEWKIQDFLLLSEKRYESPEFYFSGKSWEIWIYPNGNTNYASEGWIDLYLYGKSIDCPISVDYSFCFKTVDGKTESIRKGTKIFAKGGLPHGIFKVVSRLELFERKSELLPSDALTVICTLKYSEISDADGYENSKKVDRNIQTEKEAGVDRLVEDLKSLLLNGNSSDVTLKVEDREFKVHRNILMVRSPVFASMFQHDTKENITGIVDIPDCSAEAFEVFLSFVYSGKADAMSSDNVFDLCYTADKYQINDLKSECLKYIEENLSIENFCAAMTVSLQLSESGLQKTATNFFCGNVKTIVKTVEWQKYVMDYPVEANELFIKVIHA